MRSKKVIPKQYLFVTDNVKEVMSVVGIDFNALRHLTNIDDIAIELKKLPRNILLATYGLNKIMGNNSLFVQALADLVNAIDVNLTTDIDKGYLTDTVEVCQTQPIKESEDNTFIVSISSNYSNEVVVIDYRNAVLVIVNYQLVINSLRNDYIGTKKAILIATTNLLTYDNDFVDEALVQMHFA